MRRPGLRAIPVVALPTVIRWAIAIRTFATWAVAIEAVAAVGPLIRALIAMGIVTRALPIGSGPTAVENLATRIGPTAAIGFGTTPVRAFTTRPIPIRGRTTAIGATWAIPIRGRTTAVRTRTTRTIPIRGRPTAVRTLTTRTIPIRGRPTAVRTPGAGAAPFASVTFRTVLVLALALGERPVAVRPVAAVGTRRPVGPITVPPLRSTLHVSIRAVPIRTVVAVAMAGLAVLVPRAVSGIPAARGAIGLVVSSPLTHRTPLRQVSPAGRAGSGWTVAPPMVVTPGPIVTARPIGILRGSIVRGISPASGLRVTPLIGLRWLVRAAGSRRSPRRPIGATVGRGFIARPAAAVCALVGAILLAEAIAAIRSVAD
jgi:hypothetical protein